MSKVEPSTPDSLDDLLKKLLAAISGVRAVAIASTEGLPISWILPRDIDETKIAALSAALFSLSKQAIFDMNRGDFDELSIKGSDGYLLVSKAGPNAILLVSADKDIHLGRNLLDSGKDRFPGFPYPYIYNPPSPPDDLDAAAQTNVVPSTKKTEDREERICKHCGAPLDEGVSVCPNCKEKN